MAFARVQVALGQLFARDPLGASEQALPYAREQLARWPDMARWIEFGDATDPRLIPRDPRQFGLARALVFSSSMRALDRGGQARHEHLMDALESGAVGPMELAYLEVDMAFNDQLLWSLFRMKGLTRVTEVVLLGLSRAPLAALSESPHARGLERIALPESTRATWSLDDAITEGNIARHFPALRELALGPTAAPPERDALEPDEGWVTGESARALIERAEREGACRVRVARRACEDEAIVELFESGIPYVEVERGRGY